MDILLTQLTRPVVLPSPYCFANVFSVASKYHLHTDRCVHTFNNNNNNNNKFLPHSTVERISSILTSFSSIYSIIGTFGNCSPGCSSSLSGVVLRVRASFLQLVAIFSTVTWCCTAAAAVSCVVYCATTIQMYIVWRLYILSDKLYKL